VTLIVQEFLQTIAIAVLAIFDHFSLKWWIWPWYWADCCGAMAHQVGVVVACYPLGCMKQQCNEEVNQYH